MVGCLYLCGTPIGNLEDMTLRCIRILGEVDLIAAEDTRETVKLLNHFEIKKPMISYHEHNKVQKGPELIDMMKDGRKIALVSDAGMPAISDPGEDLVKLCIENQIDVIPVPGPSASLTALVISGLQTRRFCFEGFLPANKRERKERLKALASETRTIVIYEAPHRIKETLEELQANLGNRNISLSRELTKKFEETVRGSIEQVLEILRQKMIKGEFVIIIEGLNEKEWIDIDLKKWDNISVEEHLQMYIRQGMEKKAAIKKVAEDRRLPKKEVYKLSCDLEI